MGALAIGTEREWLVRRNTILLAFAQGLVQTTFPVMLVIGGPAASRITGREGAAGLLWGLYFLAAAAGAAVIGRWMDRVGRRLGCSCPTSWWAGPRRCRGHVPGGSARARRRHPPGGRDDRGGGKAAPGGGDRGIGGW